MRTRLYGETINYDLLELFCPGALVLDIGCGTGAWAVELRARGAVELTGVEISPLATSEASKRYDKLLTDPIEQLDLRGSEFDTIIAGDVLEHLVDPWEQLARWREWVRPGGQVVISVPNLQSVDILMNLACGRFTYQDSGGLMDRTHLRWFTHASMATALREAGWIPVSWAQPTRGRRGAADRLTRHVFSQFLQRQIQVVASVGGSGEAGAYYGGRVNRGQ